MTSLVVATAVDYLWQFQRLLPRGRVWHRGWGTLQAADLLTLMPTWARLNTSANGIIADVFPCSTVGMLPEWEATLGLPDPCTGPLDTILQRQAAVCAKFASRGGQSIAYYEKLAAALGFDIKIEQYAPFRCGINKCGDYLYGAGWAYTWSVVGPQNTTIYFESGRSRIGEPLRSWGNAMLECWITENAPAYTHVIFSYAVESIWDDAASIWDDGASRWDVGSH